MVSDERILYMVTKTGVFLKHFMVRTNLDKKIYVVGTVGFRYVVPNQLGS